jgi:hypothetical protein
MKSMIEIAIFRWQISKLWLGYCALCVVCPQAMTLAQDAEDRTLAAMSQRGLAESAVLYATSQLKNSSDPSLQAKWTMRLMECHAMAALHSSSRAGEANATVDEHWSAPDKLYNQMLEAQPENSRLPWLAWQNARCELLHAQSILASYLAVPADTNLREAALGRVREAMTKSESLLDDIQRRQPLAARQGRQGGSEAPAEQLAKLSIDTALLQCDAFLVRAKLYEAGSSDRVAAATEVDKRAAEVFARSGEDWAAREQLIAARAVAQMELGKGEQALKVLEGLARESTNPHTRIRAAVIAIEHLASQGATSRAQPLLAYLERAGAGAELALARLQLGLAEIPLNVEAKQRALNQLVNDAKEIGRLHGEYWRNRAESLLVGSVSSSSVENTALAIDLMLVEVRQLLANNDTSGAIQKLLLFRNNEAAAKHGENAIQLASKAWALLGKDSHWTEAIAALEPTLLQFPTAAGAAESHLFVISANEQILRADVGNEELGRAYAAALKRQLELWPDAIVSDEVESMLARWLIGQGKRAEFISALQSRLLACKDVEVARRSIIQWLEQVLQLPDWPERRVMTESLQAGIPQLKAPEVASTVKIVKLVAEVFSDWPNREAALAMQQELSVLQRQSNAESTSISAVELDRQLIIATELLQAIRLQKIESLPNLSAAWKPELLTSVLRRGLTQAWVEAIDESELAKHRVWIDGLKVDEAWIASLKDSPIRLEQAFAFRFLVWTTDASEGLSGLEKLSSENLRDGRIRLQFSQALVASGLNRLPESSKIAMQIAANSAPASELNLAARWRLVRNDILGGNQESAAKSASIAIATMPEEETIWKQRFQTAIR